jgi:hypothetical protein
MNGKLHVPIEWPFCSIHHNEVVDINNGGVEVLETQIKFDMGNFTSIYTYWTFSSKKFLKKFPTYMWSMFIHMCPCAPMCDL